MGLSATTVGLGLTIAGGCGVVASYAAGWASHRVPADLIQRWAMVGQGLALIAYVFAAGRPGSSWSPASRSGCGPRAARPVRP